MTAEYFVNLCGGIHHLRFIMARNRRNRNAVLSLSRQFVRKVRMMMENTKQVSKGRVMEIELMKAVAIISMVLVHVLGMGVLMDIRSPENYPVALTISFMGCFPSAGVFMFAMGWGTVFSKRATVGSYLRRCVTLFGAGLVINLFTGYVRAILVPDVYGPIGSVLHSILATDIYFFAALAQLYFALMKKLESKKPQRLILSGMLVAICFCVGVFVPAESFTTGSVWLDTILGFFIRLNDRSYFPFVSWIFFPVMGFVSAVFYQKYGMKKTTIAAVAAGVFAYIVSTLFKTALGMPTLPGTPEYYGLHPLNALYGFAIIAAEFLIVRLILLASRNRLPEFLFTMSKNVSYIYLIQWPLICILSPVLVGITNIWLNVLAGIAILVASCFLGKLLKKTNLIHI